MTKGRSCGSRMRQVQPRNRTSNIPKRDQIKIQTPRAPTNLTITIPAKHPLHLQQTDQQFTRAASGPPGDNGVGIVRLINWTTHRRCRKWGCIALTSGCHLRPIDPRRNGTSGRDGRGWRQRQQELGSRLNVFQQKFETCVDSLLTNRQPISGKEIPTGLSS